MKRKAFTLVEALVVVILIAIGAALAFSFYDEVVVEGREKAAAAYAIDSARTIGEAAQAYYLRTGNTPGSAQDLVTSGDLKAIPDPSRLLASTGIPELIALAHAENVALSFSIRYDNSYKLDGTPEGVDGYVDLAGLTSDSICGKVNERVGAGEAPLVPTPSVFPATLGCPAGEQLESMCKFTPICTDGVYNSATQKCEEQIETATISTPPSCPQGTLFYSDIDGCASDLTYVCPSGSTLDGWQCRSQNGCGAGLTADDKCISSGTYCYAAGDGTYTFHYPFAVQ